MSQLPRAGSESAGSHLGVDRVDKREPNNLAALRDLSAGTVVMISTSYGNHMGLGGSTVMGVALVT